VRIIGGRIGGIRLKSPKGRGTRPTTDRVREAIFNRLEHVLLDRGGFEGKKILDLFSGTGALGIEALSRGAEFAVFVESNRYVFDILRENLKISSMTKRAKPFCLDLNKGDLPWRKIKSLGPFDVVFADPPYGRGMSTMALNRVMSHDILSFGGIFVLEEEWGNGPSGELFGLRDLGSRRYGRTVVNMWERIYEKEDSISRDI